MRKLLQAATFGVGLATAACKGETGVRELDTNGFVDTDTGIDPDSDTIAVIKTCDDYSAAFNACVGAACDGKGDPDCTTVREDCQATLSAQLADDVDCCEELAACITVESGDAKGRVDEECLWATPVGDCCAVADYCEGLGNGDPSLITTCRDTYAYAIPEDECPQE